LILKLNALHCMIGDRMAEEKKKATIEVEDEDIGHIVRIAGKDLDGKMPVGLAITRVKGINPNLASSITKTFIATEGIPAKTRIGDLTEKQSDKLQEIIIDPVKHGIPQWQMNRRKTDKMADKHLTGHDLDFAVKGNIDAEKKSRSNRGIRHSLGLTVRGQRTRTSGRKGTTVGVTRRKNAKGSGK
jgi:small subunit ribosomal protein S13